MKISQFISKHRASDLFLLLAMNVFCHRGWFKPGIIEYGDWSYYPKEFLSGLMDFPFCWTDRFFSGALSMLFDWPLWWIAGCIARMGFDFGVAERIVYLFPYLVISVVGIYYFTYILFKRRIICFFSTLFFIFNIPTLQVLAGGILNRMVAYALMPLILAFFLKGKTKKEFTPLEVSRSRQHLSRGLLTGFTFYLICGLLLTLSVFYEPRVAYLTIIALFLFFAQEVVELIIDKKVRTLKNILMPWVYLGVVLAVPLILNFYWIYPAVASKSTYMLSGYNLSSWVKILSYFKLSHCLAVYTPWWPPGSVWPQEAKVIYYLIPLLVFTAIFFRPKDSNVRVLTLLAVVSVILSTGSNPPLGNLYLWLFRHFPGFDVFRDPGKFYMLICLAYAPLLGVSINRIFLWLGKVNFKRTK